MTATEHDTDRQNRHQERGQVAVEFLGTIGYLLLAVLAIMQLLIAVATVQGVSTAARAAARTVSQADGDPVVSARRAVPTWLADDLRVQRTGGNASGIRVSAPIIVVLPGVSGPMVTREAWFDPEHGVPPWGS